MVGCSYIEVGEHVTQKTKDDKSEGWLLSLVQDLTMWLVILDGCLAKVALNLETANFF